MKKLLLITSFAVVIFACKENKTATPDSAPNLTNVQNVNGNQPDTTSGIELDGKQSADTSKRKDTMRR